MVVICAKSVTFAGMQQESGFFFTPTGDCSEHFSEMQEISSDGFNILVRAKRLGQWWILKAQRSDIRKIPAYANLLRKEYDILNRLHHPGIVHVESLEEVEGYGQCIVMEWIDGCTLDEWLSQPHTKTERRHVANQLLSVMEFVHDQQVVHRDLKPSNIMITRNGGVVKLIDFGLSDADNYAILKGPAGTSGYISPEQMAGVEPDVRNDIYSLGVILQEMHLGASYRLAVKRCLLPLPKRYPYIGALRQRIRSLHRRLLAGSLALGVLVLGCASVAIYNKVYQPSTIYDVVATFRVGNLEYTSWGGGMVTVKAVNDKDSCIEVPATVNYQGMTYKVDEIEKEAFAHHRRLKRLVLPNTEFHVMKGIIKDSPRVESISFRCAKPPVLGNAIWPVKMEQVFDAKDFDSIILYVPHGCIVNYRQSSWGRFKQIQEYE